MFSLPESKSEKRESFVKNQKSKILEQIKIFLAITLKIKYSSKISENSDTHFSRHAQNLRLLGNTKIKEV